MTRAPNLLVVGLILLLASAATYGTLRLTYGERPAYVHVRWAPSVDTSTREQLERVHSLTRPELREGRTWGYYLTDLSRDNIQRLVTNPAAEDTHNLHRTAFRVWGTAPRAPYLEFEPSLDRDAPGVSDSGVRRSRRACRGGRRVQNVARSLRAGSRTTVTAVSWSGLRRALYLGVMGAIFVVLAGTTYQGVATALERRQLPHPGRLIDVGGHQLHLDCSGEGHPIVVLEAPSMGMSAVWGWIRQDLTSRTRVCAYDRSGLGWSEAGDSDYDPSRAIDELHVLLERATEAGPYRAGRSRVRRGAGNGLRHALPLRSGRAGPHRSARSRTVGWINHP